MHIKDLPRTNVVGLAAKTPLLEMVLATVHDGSFTDMTIIEGAARSGRVLATRPFADSVPLPRPFSAGEMAKELVRLGSESARYDPPLKQESVKGWEIGQAQIDGIPVVVAWTTWL
jgi:hypothetical protein